MGVLTYAVPHRRFSCQLTGYKHIDIKYHLCRVSRGKKPPPPQEVLSFDLLWYFWQSHEPKRNEHHHPPECHGRFSPPLIQWILAKMLQFDGRDFASSSPYQGILLDWNPTPFVKYHPNVPTSQSQSGSLSWNVRLAALALQHCPNHRLPMDELVQVALNQRASPGKDPDQLVYRFDLARIDSFTKRLAERIGKHEPLQQSKGKV